MTFTKSGLLITICLLAACGDKATLSISQGTGQNPILPPPEKSLIPTVNIAEPKGWPNTLKPTVAPGLAIQRYAQDLNHPRWLYRLPNGDVLIAESSAPPPAEHTDIPFSPKSWLTQLFMKKAGAKPASANRISLVRDTNQDGIADFKSVFLKNLNSPFGMTLVNDQLYIANADALVKVPYADGQTEISVAPQKIADLPGGLNHHWTKNVIANRDGSKLFVTVGSNSNVGENGLDIEKDRAAILEIDPKSGRYRVFASGLRNPNGMVIEPETGVLWTVVNERDELGSDLVPDYLTSVREGGFYGWPYSYYGRHVDERVQPQNPQMVEKAIVPDYALGPHTASLGLVGSEHSRLPAPFQKGMFIGQHGSWNREPKSGYKVVFVPFRNGKPDGMPIDVVTGFLDDAAEYAYGRPVGVTIDKDGALLVADDVGNMVWRISAAGK